jgi:hypothetical protein
LLITLCGKISNCTAESGLKPPNRPLAAAPNSPRFMSWAFFSLSNVSRVIGGRARSPVESAMRTREAVAQSPLPKSRTTQ